MAEPEGNLKQVGIMRFHCPNVVTLANMARRVAASMTVLSNASLGALVCEYFLSKMTI
jgi:hypothetical protein